MSINNSVLRKDINELMDKLDYNDLVELKNYIDRLNYDKELQKTYNYYFLTEGCIYDRGIKFHHYCNTAYPLRPNSLAQYEVHDNDANV